MIVVEIEVGAGMVSAGGGAVRGRELYGEIVRVEPVMGDAVLLTLRAPVGMARAVRAGHFVDILCRQPGSFDPLLRRPYSVCHVDTRQETITVLVRGFGRGSQWLTQRQVGDELDVLGLLGNTYEVSPRSRNLLMVAGGVGVAPLMLLAEVAVAQGSNVTFLMGAASGEGLLPAAMLPSAVEYVVATDDGSKGHHGFITQLVPGYVQWADQIFACGPEPMYRALRDAVTPHRLGRKPTVQLSMERNMACGLGACLGCVVETRHGMQTSCVRGPVYDMDDVVW